MLKTPTQCDPHGAVISWERHTGGRANGGTEVQGPAPDVKTASGGVTEYPTATYPVPRLVENVVDSTRIHQPIKTFANQPIKTKLKEEATSEDGEDPWTRSDPWKTESPSKMAGETSVGTRSTMALSPIGQWWANESLTNTFKAQNQVLLDRRPMATTYEVATPTGKEQGEAKITEEVAQDDGDRADSNGAETQNEATADGKEETSVPAKTRLRGGFLWRPSFADRHRRPKFVGPKRVKYEAAISQTFRRSGQCDVGTQMECHPRSHVAVRDADAQTSVTLPQRVEAHWHCHCPNADTVVDVEIETGIAGNVDCMESVQMIHGNKM